MASKHRSGKNALELSFTHYFLVGMNVPNRWPGWLVMWLGLGAALAVGWLWRLVLDDFVTAVWVGAGQWLFLAADSAVLRALPGKEISFGPWKSQFVALAIPRLVVTAVIGLLAGWMGVGWALGLALFVQLLGTALLLWGTLIEPFRLSMTEVTVPTDRLPPDALPIRLLHISDIHVERLTRREEKLLQLAAAAQPDLIVITGDYVNLSYNRDAKTHAQVRQLLNQLSAPYGVYAVLGSPPVDLREMAAPIFDGLPIPLLREDWRQVELGDGRSLVILGMDCTHHIPDDAERLRRLAAAAPNGVPQVLLYHSPELMPQAAGHDLDLYLCGHTHGGQVRLPFIGPILISSQLGRQYVMGLYRDGRTHLYVSRGVGLEGLSAPRIRFMAPPEITLVSLVGKR